MNCFYHTDKMAVAQCSQCGRFLCKECASKWKPMMCESCAQEIIKENKMTETGYFKISLILFTLALVVRLIQSVVLGIGGGSIAFLIFGVISAFVGAAVVGGIPYGWRKVKSLSSHFDIILILPIFGWVIVFLLKLIFAMLIGWLYFVPKLVTYFKYKGDVEVLNTASEMRWNDILGSVSGKFRKRSFS